mmetsp:Transcript_36959/g.80476  ORF Transcript_36959/g.80476 Transcript_36959/m.80476 type:complete len:207 (-) Transcript_36959:290-910(-)
MCSTITGLTYCDLEATTRRNQQIGRNTRSSGGGSFPTQSLAVFAPLIMSGNNSIEYYLSPRRRLDTLFAVHSTFSVLIGAIGFLFPSTASAFFLTENDREFRVARAILRPYCSLVLAQGFIIHRARKINDGEIKRAFVQAYFVCFLLSTMSLINEHLANTGVVSGKLLGVVKILAMIALTAGYGWFTFFQPPSVFSGLGTVRTHYH